MNTIQLMILTFLVLMTSARVRSLRILGIFTHFGKSHFDVFQPIMQELSERGHDVTVLSYHPQPAAGYKDLVLESDIYTGNSLLAFDMLMPGYPGQFLEVFLVHELAREGCEFGLKSQPVRELLKSKKKFDLIIIEAFNTDCYLGLVHRLKAPFIHISSSTSLPWFTSRFGQPDNPAYISNLFMGFSDKLGFGARVINTMDHIWTNLLYQYYITPRDYEFAKAAFGNDLPRLEDIAMNVSLYIINEHFTIQRSKPTVPAVINVGGVHLAKKVIKKLPKVINIIKIKFCN